MRCGSCDTSLKTSIAYILFAMMPLFPFLYYVSGKLPVLAEFALLLFLVFTLCFIGAYIFPLKVKNTT